MDKQITQIFINRNKKKDQLIFSPAKVVHTLLNESEASFKFLVIKTPTPTTETKVL